ncbi:hypothetical protein BC829DRAFT_405908 [Chytridium lagenaria]|nr:hypothetical protein BC829DRAFT_405908 [Chytridium lagenaria]
MLAFLSIHMLAVMQMMGIPMASLTCKAFPNRQGRAHPMQGFPLVSPVIPKPVTYHHHPWYQSQTLPTLSF